MQTGRILKLSPRGGYGFIATDAPGGLFFHCTVLDGLRFEELRKGQPVEFDVEPRTWRGRSQACLVRPAAAAAAVRTARRRDRRRLDQ
jgi:cold shock CspA family protein